MSDVTAVFHDIVRQKQRAIKQAAPTGDRPTENVGKAGENKASASKDEALDFYAEAKITAKQILVFQTFLLEHQSAYVDTTRHFKEAGRRLTDEERAQVDQQYDAFQRTCCTMIDQLRHYLEKTRENKNKDAYRHRCEILLCLNERLGNVVRLYQRLKTARLHTEKRELSVPVRIAAVEVERPYEVRRAGEDSAQFEKQLEQQQRLVLERENKHLLESLNFMVDEVRQTERAISEISQLQSLMENQILQQARAIEKLHDDAFYASDTLRLGNRTLATAKKQMSSFRKYALAFMLTVALMLVFLDWYYE